MRFIRFCKVIGNSDHHKIDQVQISIPLVLSHQIILCQMNMAHAVFRHVHADPHAVNFADIAVFLTFEVAIFLR